MSHANRFRFIQQCLMQIDSDSYNNVSCKRTPCQTISFTSNRLRFRQWTAPWPGHWIWIVLPHQRKRRPASSSTCMYVCIYVCVWKFEVLPHQRKRQPANSSTCMYVCMYVCMWKPELFCLIHERGNLQRMLIKCTYVRVCVLYIYIYIYIHIRTHTHTRTDAHAHTRTHTRARTHTHTAHTHTHTHIHTGANHTHRGNVQTSRE